MPENTNTTNTAGNTYVNRIPPHDQDAEQAVLGCMIFDNDGVSSAFEKLKGTSLARDVFLSEWV